MTQIHIHVKLRGLNSEIICCTLKNVHNFDNLGRSDLVISMCLDLASMYICVEYECSMINHTDTRDNCSEREKWLPSKNYRSYWLNISCAYATDIYAKCKVPLIKSVLSTDNNTGQRQKRTMGNS